MKRKLLLCYFVTAFAICVLPFAGMLWSKNQESGENRTLAELPVLKNEEGWNREFLADAGAYFEDHFAYRQEMVTADAMLRGNLLGVSVEDSVIMGTEGWLYYKDSLDDYLGNQVLSDRAIYNIAHSLKMMQDYVERSDRKFIFTVAPNKNSLYNENMPYYYDVKVSDVHNIAKLKTAIEAEGVNYVDLYHIFEEQEEVLYHKRDSHWNNKGASMAAQEILDALDIDYRSYTDAAYEIREDFEGDLDKMLFPNALTLQEEYYFTEPFTYEYVNEVESNFDPEIQTVASDKEGSLLMYRDSFGNALLPFMAQEFGNARFSRGVPYYLDDMIFCNADTVVVERAERFLPDMAQNPPVAQAPLVMLDYKSEDQWEQAEDNSTNCEVTDEGLYLKFSGVIDEDEIQDDSQIYLRLDGEFAYEAFPMTIDNDEVESDYGYAVYIEKEKLEGEEGKVELFVTTEQGVQKIFQSMVAFELEF